MQRLLNFYNFPAAKHPVTVIQDNALPRGGSPAGGIGQDPGMVCIQAEKLRTACAAGVSHTGVKGCSRLQESLSRVKPVALCGFVYYQFVL